MKVETFLDNILKKWPSIISMEGSYLIPETDGFFSPELTGFKDLLEDGSESILEEEAHWTIFRILHRVMKSNKLLENENDIIVNDISLESLKEHFIMEIKECEDSELKKVAKKTGWIT